MGVKNALFARTLSMNGPLVQENKMASDKNFFYKTDRNLYGRSLINVKLKSKWKISPPDSWIAQLWHQAKEKGHDHLIWLGS